MSCCGYSDSLFHYSQTFNIARNRHQRPWRSANYLEPRETRSHLADGTCRTAKSSKALSSASTPAPFHGSSAEYAGHRPYTSGRRTAVDGTGSCWPRPTAITSSCSRTRPTPAAPSWSIIPSRWRSEPGIDPARREKGRPCWPRRRSSAASSPPPSKPKAVERAAPTAPNLPATPITKLDYAFQLAASLGYLMIKQKDSLGLASVVDHDASQTLLPAARHRVALPPPGLRRHGIRHARRRLPTRQGHASKIALRRSAAAASSSSSATCWIEPKGDLRRPGPFPLRETRKVIVFHVMDPAEIHFPHDKLTRFKDAEGRDDHRGPAAARCARRTLDRLAEFCKAIRRFVPRTGHQLPPWPRPAPRTTNCSWRTSNRGCGLNEGCHRQSSS